MQNHLHLHKLRGMLLLLVQAIGSRQDSDTRGPRIEAPQSVTPSSAPLLPALPRQSRNSAQSCTVGRLGRRCRGPDARIDSMLTRPGSRLRAKRKAFWKRSSGWQECARNGAIMVESSSRCPGPSPRRITLRVRLSKHASRRSLSRLSCPSEQTAQPWPSDGVIVSAPLPEIQSCLGPPSRVKAARLAKNSRSAVAALPESRAFQGPGHVVVMLTADSCFKLLLRTLRLSILTHGLKQRHIDPSSHLPPLFQRPPIVPVQATQAMRLPQGAFFSAS